MEQIEKEALLKIYKEALEMEMKGHKFYTEAVEKAQSTMATQIFEQLKTDELAHMQKVQKIYDEIGNGEIDSVSISEGSMETSELKKVFVQLAEKYKNELTASDYDHKAIDLGIEFEAKAVNFYKERYENATAEGEKSFALALLKEEREHHAILQDMKEYFEDPAVWMLNHERPHMD